MYNVYSCCGFQQGDNIGITSSTCRHYKHQEKHVNNVCCCLQTCNSVVYVVVMGLVLGQSLMVISTMGIMLLENKNFSN